MHCRALLTPSSGQTDALYQPSTGLGRQRDRALLSSPIVEPGMLQTVQASSQPNRAEDTKHHFAGPPSSIVQSSPDRRRYRSRPASPPRIRLPWLRCYLNDTRRLLAGASTSRSGSFSLLVFVLHQHSATARVETLSRPASPYSQTSRSPA